MEDSFFPMDGAWGWFQDDSGALHILYFISTIITSAPPAGHQALDPRGWGPCSNPE